MNSIDLTPKLYYLDLEVSHVPKEQGEPIQCITQIAVHDPSREKAKRNFVAYIKPPKALRYKQEEMHFEPGYTAPASYKFKNVWPILKKWMNEGLDGNRFAVIVMHNGYKHDWPILQRECSRIQDAIPRFWKPFCTLYLAKALSIPGDHSLTGLCHSLSFPTLPAHNALNDVRMLKGIFKKMTEGADRKKILEAMLDREHPIKEVANIIKTHKKAMLVFFDFETTGLFPKKGEKGDNPKVVEIAGYIPLHDVSFSTLVNPGCPIPEEAQAVHHITDEDVSDAPDFKTAWTDFEKWMNRYTTITKVICLAGHNIWGYDLKVYQSECERTGLQKHRWKSIDTCYLSRHLLKGIQDVSHKLQGLREQFSIAEDHAHRASGDVAVNWKVFEKFIEGVSEDKLSGALLSDHPVLNLGAVIREEGTFKASDYFPKSNTAPISPPSIPNNNTPSSILTNTAPISPPSIPNNNTPSSIPTNTAPISPPSIPTNNGNSTSLLSIPNSRNEPSKRKFEELSDSLFVSGSAKKSKNQ